MASGYGGLDTDDNDHSNADVNNSCEEGDWLHVPGSARRSYPNSLELKEETETASLGSSSKKNKNSLDMEYGDDDEDVDDEDVDSDNSENDDDEDYELTSLADANPNPNSIALLTSTWRPKERLRCLTLLALTLAFAAFMAFFQNNPNASTLGLSHAPPGAEGVGHASYDTLHASFLEEYDARLTLYRHRATGAEFLAFVPEATRSGPGHSGSGGIGSDGGEGYDPKPDKVFGVAFRTKPESSTGVPHILEREFDKIAGIFFKYS